MTMYNRLFYGYAQGGGPAAHVVFFAPKHYPSLHRFTRIQYKKRGPPEACVTGGFSRPHFQPHHQGRSRIMNWMSIFNRTKNITTEQTREYVKTHAPGTFQLLDVRQPKEYLNGHLPGSILIPLKELPERLTRRSTPGWRPSSTATAECAAGPPTRFSKPATSRTSAIWQGASAGRRDYKRPARSPWASSISPKATLLGNRHGLRHGKGTATVLSAAGGTDRKREIPGPADLHGQARGRPYG